MSNNMGKADEFMEKVSADEALQKEFAQIIGEGGTELTKEQEEKIAEPAAKSGIELDLEGELSDEELVGVIGGKYDCYYESVYENAAVCTKCGSGRLKKGNRMLLWNPPYPNPVAYSVTTECEDCGYAWRYCSDKKYSSDAYAKGLTF